MLDTGAWDAIASLVTPEDFYRGEHRTIFRAMEWLAADNKPLDIVTLAESLESHGELDAIGGLPYLSELAESTPSASNVTAYAEIVQELSLIHI